jgi:hypothetical protein
MFPYNTLYNLIYYWYDDFSTLLKIINCGMMPHVCNLPLTADMLDTTLYVSTGTAAAWNMAAVRDQNMQEHQNYVPRRLLQINLCI